MKKVLVVMLIIVLTLSLVACNKEDKPMYAKESPTNSPENTKEVSFEPITSEMDSESKFYDLNDIFKSRELRQEMKAIFGTDENLSHSDFEEIKYLDLSEKNIDDITGLAYLSNLEELNLSDNQIKDISEISGLVSITELNISNNEINDISSLSDITKLINLDLGKTRLIQSSQ